MGSRDRVLMGVLVALIAALVILTSASRGPSGSDPRRSTFLGTPEGTRALMLTLRELKVPVARRTEAFTEGDSLTGALALLAPPEEPTPGELHALAGFVRRGGTLLYAARFSDPVMDTLGLRLEELGDTADLLAAASFDGAPARPAGTHPWTAGTERVDGFRSAFAAKSRVLKQGAVTLLATRKGRPVALSFRMGRGTVLALSDSRPLGNARLREGGAALLFARAAADATRGGVTLRFDEYHQGFHGDGSVSRAMSAFLRRTGLGHAVLQCALAALGLLLLLGRRFGAPVPPPPAERRSPLEHVEALAGAYRQSGARATARRLLVAGMARRMGRKAARDAAAQDEMVSGLAQRMPVARDAARELGEEWNKGDGADLVALSGKVDRLLQEAKRT